MPEESKEKKIEYSETFQLQLIAELLRNKDFAVITAPNILPSYFSKDILGNSFKILFNYIEEFKNVPYNADIFLDHARDMAKKNRILKVDDAFINLINMMYMKQSDGTWRFLYDINNVKAKTNKFIRNAAMERALETAIEKFYEGDDYEEIKPLILKALTVGVTDIGIKFFSEVDAIVDRFIVSRRQQVRIPTPLKELNYYTNGGVGKKEMFVILAPPNRGKSLAMGSFAATAALYKKKVVYYTMEMEEDKIAWRLIRQIGNFSEEEMLFQSDEVKAKIKRIAQMLNIERYIDPVTKKMVEITENRDIVIKFFTSKSCTINSLYSHLALLEAQGFVPDIVFVDYADLITPDVRYKDKRAELSGIYTALRDLAVEKEVALITASQTNRGGLSKELVKAEDIAEDFGKVAIADIIVTLTQTETEHESGKMRVYVAKNRDGVVNKTIHTDVNYTTMALGAIEVDVDYANNAQPLRR